MCIVSLVSDSLTPRPSDITGNLSYVPQITIGQMDNVSVLLLHEAIKRLDEIDKRNNLRDCKDEAKEKFLNELAARVDAIEKSKAEARAALLRIAAKRKLPAKTASKKRGNNVGSKKGIRYR